MQPARYARQIIYTGAGEAGQRALLDTRVRNRLLQALKEMLT